MIPVLLQAQTLYATLQFMTKIQETLYILHKCHINIQLVWEESQKYQQKGLKSVHHFTNNLALRAILFVDF